MSTTSNPTRLSSTPLGSWIDSASARDNLAPANRDRYIAPGMLYCRPLIILATVLNMAQAAPFTSSNLPIIIINTQGRTIPGSPKITAWMGIIYNGEGRLNFVTDTPNNYDGHIGIELRGSSSLMFPKKQYALETRDSNGDNLNVALLGMPRENDWILYAPYSDKTLIRNILAYKLAADMGWYASRSRLCELVLNDEYWGVYVLLEKIKRDNNRVDISKLNSDELSGDDLTGGYIIKVDKTDGENVGGWSSSVRPYPGAWQKIFYQYHYPKPDDIVPEQVQYIQTYIGQFETLMQSASYNDPVTGYASLLDVPSFIDFVISNELAKNVDGYRLSAFMYKDRDSHNTRMVMGPIWDFNLGYGNADYYDGAPSDGWILEYLTTNEDFRRSDGFQVPFWWPRLFADAAFAGQLQARWLELRQGVLRTTRIMALIDSLTTMLDEPQARNFELWDILGKYIWPNAFVAGSYFAEIDTLSSWLTARLEWMDRELLGYVMELVAEGSAGPESYFLFNNYPNPFNPTTTIAFGLAQPAIMHLTVYDLLGREVNLLLTGEFGAGSYRVTWDGRSKTGRQAPSGVYFARLTAPGYSSSIKMVLLR